VREAPARVLPGEPASKMLSVRQVAEHLGVSEKTVRRMAARGSLPCYHVGRLVRFAPGDVFLWLEARKEA